VSERIVVVDYQKHVFGGQWSVVSGQWSVVSGQILVTRLLPSAFCLLLSAFCFSACRRIISMLPRPFLAAHPAAVTPSTSLILGFAPRAKSVRTAASCP